MNTMKNLKDLESDITKRKESFIEQLEFLLQEEVIEDEQLIPHMEDVQKLTNIIHEFRDHNKEFDEHLQILERQARITLQLLQKKFEDALAKSLDSGK